VALVIAMSGSAYAATGGTFILGKANQATTLTSLSNSDGTALALSSAHGKPPRTVNSSVQVPKLNATELDSPPATAFLPATGTAANSNELGGVPADQFLLGNGVSQTVSVGARYRSLAGGTAYALFNCTSTGLTPVAAFTIESVTNNAQVWRLNKDGEGYTTLNQGQTALLAQSDTAPYTVVVQVASAAGGAATPDLSMAVDDSAQTCSFAAQSASGD
jgi:hypothetical protein